MVAVFQVFVSKIGRSGSATGDGYIMRRRMETS